MVKYQILNLEPGLSNHLKFFLKYLLGEQVSGPNVCQFKKYTQKMCSTLCAKTDYVVTLSWNGKFLKD